MNSVKEVKYFSTGENITKWQSMTLNPCFHISSAVYIPLFQTGWFWSQLDLTFNLQVIKVSDS